MSESTATRLANLVLDHVGDGGLLTVIEHLDDTIEVISRDEGRLFRGESEMPGDLVALVASKVVPHAGLTEDDSILDVLSEMGAEVTSQIVVAGAQGLRLDEVQW